MDENKYKINYCFNVGFYFSKYYFIPLLMNVVGARMAFVLGHGLITSFLVVITFKLINKEKTVLAIVG